MILETLEHDIVGKDVLPQLDEDRKKCKQVQQKIVWLRPGTSESIIVIMQYFIILDFFSCTEGLPTSSP